MREALRNYQAFESISSNPAPNQKRRRDGRRINKKCFIRIGGVEKVSLIGRESG
jgi:hypothetical protein